MLEKYEPRKQKGHEFFWYYGNGHGKIKAPWWSGMDALFGPLTLYAAYELTGIEKYRDIALASAKLAIEPPSGGGVLWREKNGCWISEYAWNGMEFKDEFFVLNGHLWGLQALQMLAVATGDSSLQEAYACANKGTKVRKYDFFNKSKTWPWYMLNVKTINSVHYLLLEMAQFRAMHALTGEFFYKEEAEARASIFRHTYPLQLVQRSNGLSVVFSMIGPPHPYWTDTYPVTLECKVNGEALSARQARHYSSDPLDQRFFVELKVPSSPSICSVTVHPGQDVLVYSQNDFLRVTPSNHKIPLNDLALGMDAQSVAENGVAIVPAHENQPGIEHYTNNEARIGLPVPSKIAEGHILALIIKPERDVNIGFLLQDMEGRHSHRYYPKLIAGKDNIVLLNRLGFDGNDSLGNELKMLFLRVYTEKTQPSFFVDIKSFEVLENSADLQDFFARHRQSYFHQE
ncbi:MAG: D-glucuronyl C5-epimerase family protein [Desulforhabdus sp.]|nr:D-glucuronyl C5-epimerase family protein [Desulforhabdus sp.]